MVDINRLDSIQRLVLRLITNIRQISYKGSVPHFGLNGRRWFEKCTGYVSRYALPPSYESAEDEILTVHSRGSLSAGLNPITLFLRLPLNASARLEPGLSVNVTACK